MKKFISLSLILLILFGCSLKKEGELDKYIKKNSEVCLSSLKKDEYTKACKDLESESRDYINKVELENISPNIDLYENIINDLYVISDVSQNKEIKKLAKNTRERILLIIAPISREINIDNYKEVSDESDFKDLLNSFIEKTSLTYTSTEKFRNSYDSKDLRYKTIFTDENTIYLTYYLNKNKDLVKIEINNDKAEEVLYYNFAKLYTKHILKDQLKLPLRSANHDSLLVAQMLQFNNNGEFLSEVEILIKDKTVIIKLD